MPRACTDLAGPEPDDLLGRRGMSVCGRALTAVAKLSTVPAWAHRPLPAVADVEDFLLRLFRRTESPEALAGFITLSWLGGDETAGPLLWAAAPEERFASAFLAVADALAEGEPYPALEWWGAEAGCLGPMTEAQWNERAGSWPERFYAHGVVCALGWVLGGFDDPAIMAPGTAVTAARWATTSARSGGSGCVRARSAASARRRDLQVASAGPDGGARSRRGRSRLGCSFPAPLAGQRVDVGVDELLERPAKAADVSARATRLRAVPSHVSHRTR